jgi:hypothetical protein
MTHTKVFEGSRTVGADHWYALAISTSIDSANPIESEIRHINEAIINWVRSRGPRCESLSILYRAATADVDQILSRTKDLMNQDIPEIGVLKGAEVEVVFQNGGRIHRQFKFGPPPARA